MNTAEHKTLLNAYHEALKRLEMYIKSGVRVEYMTICVDYAKDRHKVETR